MHMNYYDLRGVCQPTQPLPGLPGTPVTSQIVATAQESGCEVRTTRSSVTRRSLPCTDGQGEPRNQSIGWTPCPTARFRNRSTCSPRSCGSRSTTERGERTRQTSDGTKVRLERLGHAECFHPLDRTLSTRGHRTHRLDALLRRHDDVLVLGVCLRGDGFA